MKLSIRSIIIIIFWSLIIAVAVNIFLLPAGLFTVGMTGIAMVLEKLFSGIGIPLTFSIIYFLINIPGVILGFTKIGKRFTIYSLISIASVSIFAKIIPQVSVTEDLLLNSIFAGVLLGFAAGGILKNAGSAGGVDFYLVYLMMTRKKSFKFLNFLVNFIIIILLGFTYSLEIALYTIINLYAMTLAIGIIYTNYERITMLIIIDRKKAEAACAEISSNFYRGMTLIDAKGAYEKAEKTLIYTVVSKYEIEKMKEILHKHDDNVFINTMEGDVVTHNFFEKYEY